MRSTSNGIIEKMVVFWNEYDERWMVEDFYDATDVLTGKV